MAKKRSWLSMIAQEGQAQRFRANKRAFWSLWIFLGLFFVTLPAEFLANDKPLVLFHQGRLMFPIFQSVTEKDLGGEFELPVIWRESYVQEELMGDGDWMLMPLIPYSYDTSVRGLTQPAPSPPTWQNILGTDENARDILAGVIYGFRISVIFGLLLTIFSTIIGVLVGGTMGYFGGALDLWGQRFIEVWSSMPTLFILIILASVIVPSFWWLLGITLLFGWIGLVGVVRAEFLRARNFDFVQSARAMGLSHFKIMFRHILPNAAVATITNMPFILVGGITTLTSLDFLGFGLPPGSPSLGDLVAQGKANPQAPWLGITAFVALGSLLVLLVFVGEGVRDALDSRRNR